MTIGMLIFCVRNAVEIWEQKRLKVLHLWWFGTHFRPNFGPDMAKKWLFLGFLVHFYRFSFTWLLFLKSLSFWWLLFLKSLSFWSISNKILAILYVSNLAQHLNQIWVKNDRNGNYLKFHSLYTYLNTYFLSYWFMWN